MSGQYANDKPPRQDIRFTEHEFYELYYFVLGDDLNENRGHISDSICSMIDEIRRLRRLLGFDDYSELAYRPIGDWQHLGDAIDGATSIGGLRLFLRAASKIGIREPSCEQIAEETGLPADVVGLFGQLMRDAGIDVWPVRRT